MEISKQIMKDANIYPRLKLLVKEDGKPPISTGKHTVKLIKDKEIVGKDINTGKEIQKVRYLVEEKGELKIYDTRKFNKDTGEVNYLVQTLSEYPEKSIVILEAKKVGVKNYISVTPANHSTDVEVEDDVDNEE